MSDKEKSRVPSLREYVSAIILDIANGLNDAQEKGRELGVKINPYDFEDTSTPMEIEFDLSVKSIAQDKEGDGFSIKAWCFGIDKGKECTENAEIADRIRFKLPVHYIVMNRGRCKLSGDWNPVAGKM